MVADDLLAALVGGLRVVVILADIVGAERAVVVRVRFAVRDRVVFIERLLPAVRIYPGQYL